MKPSLLSRLRDSPEELGSFALLVRSHQGIASSLEILRGNISEYSNIAEIPLPPENHIGPSVLCMLPYCQIRERGYECINDGEPLQVMEIEEVERVDLGHALTEWPLAPIEILDSGFDIDDRAYSELVRRIIEDEINKGEGANFVIKRTYMARIKNFSVTSALTAFRNLVSQECKAHWIFLVHTNERTWIGASPEQHLALNRGVVNMNPISGTYRYPKNGATVSGVLNFLNDRKESDELHMVVDEELKMMSRFCRERVKVLGPRLKLMSHLAHTEYILEGKSSVDPRIILRETLFSPAVTGSPVQNACRIISRYETKGREYYAGVLALLGRDDRLNLSLDSAIIIRTADISSTGRAHISVGATIVRHSDPSSEALETRAKASAIVNSFKWSEPQNIEKNAEVMEALRRRTTGLSEFWLSGFNARGSVFKRPLEHELLIIDAEDSFTEMLAHQLHALGLKVAVARVGDQRVLEHNWDLAVFGPGPGDPNDLSDLRINGLRKALRQALLSNKPFLAVCLSHQLLCLELGIPVVRLGSPNQGVQLQINYFGTEERVGFYNTFCAKYSKDRMLYSGKEIEINNNPSTGEIHAIRSPRFISTQFHPESILTQNGSDLLREALLHITGE